jgi:hypothetical protein
MPHIMAICGGRLGAHRLLAATVTLLLGVAVVGTSASTDTAPVVTIGRDRDAYTVDARFDVPQPAALALRVLTDYEAIPRYMPDVKKSVVRHRYGHYAIVEQEVVSRVMMFSKRVHLRLAIVQSDDTLRFRDELGTSFHRYEGRWELTERADRTSVRYHLVAHPSFSVPAFLIRRLLARDANETIERLRAEIAARAPTR